MGGKVLLAAPEMRYFVSAENIKKGSRQQKISQSA